MICRLRGGAVRAGIAYHIPRPEDVVSPLLVRDPGLGVDRSIRAEQRSMAFAGVARNQDREDPATRPVDAHTADISDRVSKAFSGLGIVPLPNPSPQRSPGCNCWRRCGSSLDHVVDVDPDT